MPEHLLVPPERAVQLRDASRTWPSIDLDAHQLCDLELLLNGAFGPLAGFMSHAEYDSVTHHARLPDGTIWPTPVTLELPAAMQHDSITGDRVALRDREGVMLAALSVREVWTDGAGRRRAAGRLEGIQLPAHHDFPGLRKTPAQLRERFTRERWPQVACLQPPAPASTAVLPSALDTAASLEMPLLVHLITGPASADDGTHYQRVRGFEEALTKSGRDRAVLAILPLRLEAAGARALMLQALVAKNFGCTHLLVSTEIPDEARRHAWEIGVEFIAIAERASSRLAEPAGPSERSRQGFTIFFTGLSGSGKSTIANAVVAKLMELGGRKVSLLDGDVVRKHLSSELGFSREDRDLNIRRIGYVASEITKHGGVAICAPIAPYDAMRKDVRRMIEAQGRFILVYVSTPLEVCEQRDRKGLYAKARSGLVPQFTGISDPYEPPTDAALVIDSSTTSAEEAATAILEYVRREGLV